MRKPTSSDSQKFKRETSKSSKKGLTEGVAPQIIMVEQFSRSRATSEPPAVQPQPQAQDTNNSDRLSADKEKLFKQITTRIKANDAALKVVNLQGFNIKKKDMKILADALRVNTKVETLDFSECGLKHPELCLPILSVVLSESKTVKTLDLSKNMFGPKALRAVEDLIQTNMSITNLILGDEFQDSGVSSSIQIYLSSNRNYEKVG